MKSFQSFRLESANQCLWRGDERAQITPKAFDVLRSMTENARRLVTQDEFLEGLSGEALAYHAQGRTEDSRREADFPISMIPMKGEQSWESSKER